jgi:hypothetical protein
MYTLGVRLVKPAGDANWYRGLRVLHVHSVILRAVKHRRCLSHCGNV